MNRSEVSHDFSVFTRPHVQIICMVFTSMLLFSTAIYRMHHCAPIDPSPSVQNEHQDGYPIQTHIKSGIFIRNFLEFDVLTNKFTADAYVWFEYDPKQIPAEAIDDFYFGKATIKNKSQPYTYTKDGKTFTGYNVQIHFQTNLNYRHFPIDNHRIYLTLNNASLPKYHAAFITAQSSFQVAETIYAYGWTYKDRSAKTGLQINTLDDVSQKKLINQRIIFSLDFSNESFKRFILITLPLFILFFLSLFTLSLDARKQYETVVGIAAAMMTALVSYNFVIESASPKVAYFTLSDTFFNLFLVLNFLIFLFDAICIRWLMPYRGLLVIFFHLLLIISWIILLFWWI